MNRFTHKCKNMTLNVPIGLYNSAYDGTPLFGLEYKLRRSAVQFIDEHNCERNFVCVELVRL